jgi:hypothetical protein
VIHIVTAHDRQDRWVAVQRRYLREHTDRPHRLYASMQGIDPGAREGIHYVLDDDGAATGRGRSIGETLTVLGEEASRQAEDPDDLLVFMHGDVFPIADWLGPVGRMLAERPLAAIRRDENLEPIPHESFCATTVGFWAEIGGRWESGIFTDLGGRRVRETGGTLWSTLDDRGIEWHPILRTNATDLHPLWFGVYGGFLYHHGAGFRAPMSRRDAAAYAHLPVPIRNLAGVRKRLANTRLSRRMYRRILDDQLFYLTLTDGARR